MFFLFDLRRHAAGSRERRVSASKRLCPVRFSCWNPVLVRGFFSIFNSHARRGSFFQCKLFRFDFDRFSDRSMLRSKKVSKIDFRIDQSFDRRRFRKRFRRGIETARRLRERPKINHRGPRERAKTTYREPSTSRPTFNRKYRRKIPRRNMLPVNFRHRHLSI